MTSPMYTPESSHSIADDELSGDTLTYLECENLSRTSVQPMPYDPHHQRNANYDLEPIEESSVSIIPAYHSETDTVSSQEDEWVITGPTDPVPPTSGGRSYKGEETVTVSSVDGEATRPEQPGGLSSPNSDRAGIAALRFGYDKKIILYRLENGKPITFVCCDETFPSLRMGQNSCRGIPQRRCPLG